jgi:hypothetical protein
LTPHPPLVVGDGGPNHDSERAAGAPDEMRWFSDGDPIFIGIVGLPNTVAVTVGGGDYMPLGSGATFSHPKDKS